MPYMVNANMLLYMVTHTGAPMGPWGPGFPATPVSPWSPASPAGPASPSAPYNDVINNDIIESYYYYKITHINSSLAWESISSICTRFSL